MKRFLVMIVGIWLVRAAVAQTWTLRQCIDYALAHNIGIKQAENQCRQQELQLSTARNARLPNLDASVGENFSFGRGLTAENTYTNTNTNSTSFSLGTSIPLFTGFQIPNAIQLNRLNLEAATMDLAKAKDDIRMQVAQAYVEVLYDMEISDVARRQIGIDSLQVARLQALLEVGKASEAEVSQQRATLAQSQLTATQADNQQRLALLALTQLLELTSPDGFSIVRPTTAVTVIVPPLPDAVFQEALAVKPQVQAEQLRLQGTEHSIRIAEAALYPQLSLSGGLGTNYYKTGGLPADAFGTQLKNNFSQYVGISLNIPIFNRFQTRNNVRSARLSQENQQLQLSSVRKQLYKEIQQVYYNVIAAGARLQSSEAAERAGSDAFTLMQAKYENGKANLTEFNEAKNSYLRAASELVQARYEYLYQCSLLDFYRGRELNF
ncbi:MAG: TolC family protein [Prevotella sp.]|nr:TolC family protein [Prevotella sp.]